MSIEHCPLQVVDFGVTSFLLLVLYLDHVCIHVKHDAAKYLYLMLMKTNQQDCLHSMLVRC